LWGVLDISNPCQSIVITYATLKIVRNFLIYVDGNLRSIVPVDVLS
jgi:hypothetical protein